ncbi:hypothetical protein [Roseicella sp. DB1501]|uniref:hypothetical protein n=1 Tax=Roseicella sp. DB1501 TaxID=2730925 RepID=UPI0014931287|nr:hypothetical protein [Roseicella sp. DB1501]
MFLAMIASATAAETLSAMGAFVARILAEHPDRGLPPMVLVATLRDVEQVEGDLLEGAAVELGRRLARLHGLPAPRFPCDFHLDFSAAGDRDLALHALRQAQRLQALARPHPSREAAFLLLGAARLLAADPLIRPPPTRPALAPAL